ncbi:periostin-like [Ruditapes philippinarum]|uniref:periostin-like n=1 Tax=Ruditapes philippinarum TaxID=129788 RepID=UPI00295B2261|nr:periostin-like [Ruditapes philippinarum]
MGPFFTAILTLAFFRQANAFIDKNVYQCLVDYNLTSVAGLIRDAKLESTLTSSTGGPFTIMAPTNAAVAAIDPDTMASVIKSSVLLQQIVKYHIINKYEVIPALISAGSVETMEGQSITVTSQPSGIRLNNASTVLKDNGDIICNNGIIHVIDTVLIPPVFSTHNLAAVLLERDDIFREFFLYALLSNFTHLIENGEYTLFAPTDLAFGRYSHLNDIHRDTPNAGKIYLEILKYHIVPGARMSNMLSDGQILYTLHGSPITIHLNNGGVKVDDANVVEANIPGSNGVIHAIDHVLFPADLLPNLQG